MRKIRSLGLKNQFSNKRFQMIAVVASISVIGTVFTFLARAQTVVTSAKSGAWSNAATWQGGKVPVVGDKVIISAGHDVLYDQTDTTVGGMDLAGTLTFDPNKSGRLNSDQNVLVTGQLVMAPKTTDIKHELRFVNVNEAAFVGGGMDVLPSDVGLWVMGNGQLYTKGGVKRGWTNAVDTVARGSTTLQLKDASGWKVGDKIAISPTHKPNFVEQSNNDNYLAFHEATITAVTGNTVTIDKPTTREHPKVNGKWTAEVMNFSRNVLITSQDYAHKAHIFIRSNKPQFIRHTEIAYMAPGEVFDEGYQARNQVLGRYALHFHHSGNGTRGSIVEGTSLHHTGFRGYVPHESHGITFRDTIAYDIGGGAYWWDNFEKAHDILWDRTIAAKVTSSEGAYYMGGGDNVELRDSVAVGISAGGATGGIEWENGQDGSWDFNNNIVHNTSDIGLRIWQNTSINHIVSNFAVYYTNGPAIELGAYTNDYHFRDFEIYGHGGTGIRLLAVARGVNVLVENGVIDGANVSKAASIAMSHSAVPGRPNSPTIVRNVVLKGRAAQTSPAAVVFEGAANDKKLDLINVSMEGAGPTQLVAFLPGASGNTGDGDGQTWARVQNATESYRLRPADQNLDAGATSHNNGNAWKVNIPRFRSEHWGKGNGLLTEIFDDLELTQKVYTGIDPYVRYVKEDRPLYHLLDNKNTGARFSGRVMAQYTGRYEFITESTKERLWVNGQKIIDTWGSQLGNNNTPVSGYIDLVAGQIYNLVFEASYQHEIKPNAFNDTFYASLDWKQPGSSLAEAIDLPQLYMPTGYTANPFKLNDVPTAPEPSLPSYISANTGGGTTTPPSTIKPGDVNGDGTINIFDLSQLLANWNSTSATASDLNKDGRINIFDLSLLLANWNQ